MQSCLETTIHSTFMKYLFVSLFSTIFFIGFTFLIDLNIRPMFIYSQPIFFLGVWTETKLAQAKGLLHLKAYTKEMNARVNTVPVSNHI